MKEEYGSRERRIAIRSQKDGIHLLEFTASRVNQGAPTVHARHCYLARQSLGRLCEFVRGQDFRRTMPAIREERVAIRQIFRDRPVMS